MIDFFVSFTVTKSFHVCSRVGSVFIHTRNLQILFTKMVKDSNDIFLKYLLICATLRDLVAFVQFKKREKYPWRSVNFSKVAGFKPTTLLKSTLFHRCFSCF